MAMIQATVMSMRPMLRFFIGLIFLRSRPTAHRTLPEAPASGRIVLVEHLMGRGSGRSTFFHGRGQVLHVPGGISTTIELCARMSRGVSVRDR